MSTYQTDVFVDRPGLASTFFPVGKTNAAIGFMCGDRQPFSVIATSDASNLNMFSADAVQYVGPVRHEDGLGVDNITDWALKQFKDRYKVGSTTGDEPSHPSFRRRPESLLNGGGQSSSDSAVTATSDPGLCRDDERVALGARVDVRARVVASARVDVGAEVSGQAAPSSVAARHLLSQTGDSLRSPQGKGNGGLRRFPKGRSSTTSTRCCTIRCIARSTRRTSSANFRASRSMPISGNGPRRASS